MYSVGEMAKLSGVSTRTLRYYDEIGLLCPSFVAESGYRYYGLEEVKKLQQILFYREREVPLKTIVQLMGNGANAKTALYEHLDALKQKQMRLSAIIATLEETLKAEEEGNAMPDEKRFEGFKQQLVEENEAKYGKEARSRYGDAAVDAANEKILNMDEAAFDDFKTLEDAIRTALNEAVDAGIAPESEAGERIAKLHTRWLKMSWKVYNREMHLGLADGYLADERFIAYYDKDVPGCTRFLRDALHRWL